MKHVSFSSIFKGLSHKVETVYNIIVVVQGDVPRGVSKVII
jgi:hypothetical protein